MALELAWSEQCTLDNVSCARVSEPSADPEDLALLSPDEREKRRSFEAKSECVIINLLKLTTHIILCSRKETLQRVHGCQDGEAVDE